MKDDDEIINLDNLPFEIRIKKHNKYPIRIPAWLGALTPLITQKKYIQELVVRLFDKIFDKYDPTVEDVKLIKSILEELERLNKNK